MVKMKILIISFFIIIGLNEINGSTKQITRNALQLAMSPRGVMEDKVLQIVKDFTDRMCHEIPKFELPRLDPFNLEFLELNFIKDFEISLADVEITGLSDLQIPKLKFFGLLIKFDGTIQLDHLNLMSNYTLKGQIPGFLDIDGKGQLGVDVGVLIDFSVRLKASTEAKLRIEIGKLEVKLIMNKFRITGLFPDQELNDFFEDLIENLAAEVFDDFWVENKELVIGILEPLISAPVSDFTPDELLKLITSGKPIFDESDPPPNCKDS